MHKSIEVINFKFLVNFDINQFNFNNNALQYVGLIASLFYVVYLLMFLIYLMF